MGVLPAGSAASLPSITKKGSGDLHSANDMWPPGASIAGWIAILLR